MTGLLGGVFDPPHLGHVALARAAKERFALERLVILVSDRPGHKQVELPGETRLALARAAFPAEEVELDPYPRTIDLLRAGRFDDPLFLIGADELSDFPGWKEPEAVLELARLGVATRPGYPREELERVRATLAQPERVQIFELEPLEITSREIRRRVADGESVDELVPPAVARELEARGLYRR